MAARLCGAGVHAKLTEIKGNPAVLVQFSKSIDEKKQKIFANALLLSNYETNHKTGGKGNVIDEIKFE